jgi:hypothetical protein
MSIISGNLADGKPMEKGGYYNARVWDGNKLLEPGVDLSGNKISNEVISQTNPNNVAYVDQQRIKADQINAPTPISLSSSSPQADYVTGVTAGVDQAKQALQDSLTQQQAGVDAQLATLKEKEKNTLEQDIKPLVSPFREELENAERDRLFINKNFQENQVLINELDSLLTEGNELIRQQKEVTGLAAVRNPRIQKSMDDVAARTGVIQAVINARNGQIAVAENMIDRSVNAIAADRNDQISYYETILNLNRQDIVSLDAKSQKLAEEQLAIKKNDLAIAQESAEYIKKLLVNPGTASLMGEGGVKLTDSVGEINAKLTQATYAREVKDMSNAMVADGAQAVISPKGVPADELRALKDSKGRVHYFRVKDKTTGTGTGTASERSVSRAISTISTNNMNFPDVVVNFANQLTLSEIYSAYTQSEMGKQWGLPTDSSQEIALLYKWARGEITENEYRVAIGG